MTSALAGRALERRLLELVAPEDVGLQGWRGAWKASLRRRVAQCRPGAVPSDEAAAADVTRDYVECLLETLEALQRACRGSEKYVLDIRGLVCVRAALEAVVLFGAYPALHPGVGLPITGRSPRYFLVEELFVTRAPGTSPTSDASVVDEVAGQQLVVAFNRWVGDLERSPDDLSALTERLCRLLDIAGLPDHDGPTPDGAVSQTVSDVLWQRHTVDLYAMLLQAAFPLGQAPPRSEEALGRLRSRLPLQLQFEALLQLIGAVNNPATPLPRGTVGTEADRASRAHYEARIGEALTWLLLRPNGVLALLATLLVGVEPDNVAVVEHAVRVVMSVPRKLAPADYFAGIAPQIARLLGEPGAPAPMVCAAVLLVGRLAEPLATRLFVDPWRAFWRRREDAEAGPSESAQVYAKEELTLQLAQLAALTLTKEAPLGVRLADALLDVWASLFEVLLVARDEDGLGDRLANVVTAATNALSDAARATFLLRAARAAPYEAAQTAACVLSNVDASGAALRVASNVKLPTWSLRGDVLADVVTSWRPAGVQVDAVVTLLGASPSLGGGGGENAMATEVAMGVLRRVSPSALEGSRGTLALAELVLDRAADDEDLVLFALSLAHRYLASARRGAEARPPEDGPLALLLRAYRGHANNEVAARARDALAALLATAPAASARRRPAAAPKPPKVTESDALDLLLASDQPAERAEGVADLRALATAAAAPSDAHGALFVRALAQLGHEDSFVHLGVVAALAEMAARDATGLLPLITGAALDRARAEDARLQAIEALAVVVQDSSPARLSSLLPHFLPALFDDFTSQLEPLFHASCLTLVAAVVRKMWLPPAELDRLVAASVVMSSDFQPEYLRRGALLVMAEVVKSLPEGTAVHEHARLLLDARRHLTRVEGADPDEVCRAHARDALSAIDGFMSTFFRPALPRD